MRMLPRAPGEPLESGLTRPASTDPMKVPAIGPAWVETWEPRVVHGDTAIADTAWQTSESIHGASPTGACMQSGARGFVGDLGRSGVNQNKGFGQLSLGHWRGGDHLWQLDDSDDIAAGRANGALVGGAWQFLAGVIGLLAWATLTWLCLE